MHHENKSTVINFDPQFHPSPWLPHRGLRGAGARRSIRLPGYDYSQPGAYFLTIVTYQREWIFGSVVDHEIRLSDCGRLADECWRLIPDHFPQVELGANVVMPNHVHGIIILNEPERGAATTSPPVGAQHVAPLPVAPLPVAPRRPRVVPGSLGAIIRAYKSSVTRIIAREHDDPSHIWQRNYYDHIIRNEQELQAIRDYILNNPVN